MLETEETQNWRINRRRLEKRFVIVMAIIFAVPILVFSPILLYFINPDCIFYGYPSYVEIPSSARNLERQVFSQSRSCTVRFKFRVASNELERFIETTFIQLPLSSTEFPQTIGGIGWLQAETGWRLDAYTSYLAGEARGTGDNFLDEQMIFVDTSNPEDYVVYFTTKVNWL